MIPQPIPFRRTLALPICMALCGGHAAQAQVTPPTAGQVLRDLQQTPISPATNAGYLQRIEEVQDSAQTANQATDAQVTVKAITITGNREVATAQLQPLIANLVGTQRSLAQLNAAARRITAYYRSQGFAVARAYLPAQDITDGVVTVAILEGRISSQKLSNSSRLPDARAQAFLAGIKDGDVIKSKQIDRGLLLLQDTPGVASSRATLQPGASPGTSELLIEVKPADALSGNATLDNYGSRSTGQYRAGAALNVANPLGRGDLFSLNALTSVNSGAGGLSFARIGYQLPVGSDGLRVGAAYFNLRYKLGNEFAPLLARGTASSTTVFGSYPFIRSQTSNLNGTLSYEDKTTTDFVDSTATITGKKIKLTSLGLSGNWQDSLGSGAFSSVEVSLIQGKLAIQSPTALALDSTAARTNGAYSKVTWAASRQQRITDELLLAVNLNGQQAGKNLDSSEKFTLGGPTGIRAYPSGEGSGDEGYRGTIELRQTLMQNMMQSIQGVVFYDFGSVRVNKTPFGAAGAANNKTLAGAGFGVNASINKVQLKAVVAWRVGSDLPVSIPASAVKAATVWLQASVGF